MLLSLDGTFLIQMLNFVVFWVLLNYLFIAPTRRAIEERQRRIAALYKEAEQYAAQTRALQAQADSILDEARRTVDEAMRESAARAADETHAIERRASEEAAAIIALAQATVASERTRAAEKQALFVEELSRTMAHRALGNEAAS
jgi:F-type H+-transporting ATPase subunit b